ncbi:hypothetical protein Y032_0232g3039 [Ancylostoma ceylanicum]|uniref:Tyrosine-protein kinase n=2 Tax=Ancylostoma ceylanicum TaxID=53326 RepID=A0A016SFA9_9BILA|nr:hypothetical protein Y032_0232g3039 [Ancylostoma ceylanicum]
MDSFLGQYMADSGGADDTVPPCENFDPDLVNQSYYHGWLPRDDLPHLLQRHGDFLVRITEADSLGTRLEMVLSALHDPEGRYTHRRRGPVNEEDIVHIIIQSVQHKYYMDDSKLFNTVDDLIDHFSRHSISVRDLKVRIRRAVCLGSWEFRAQDVRLGESIGKSGCIEVRKGSFEKDGKSTEASVTTVRGRSPYAKQTIVEMMRQCRMLRDLHHPCVVEFYGVCLLTHPCCFLLEYVSEGPLNEYLKKGQGRFKRDELLLMVMSAGWGLEFIHSHGIIHRDLGARNCFYDKQLVKISGFGLARKASTYTMKVLKKLSVHWMAPETVEEFLYSQKSDVYSFGVSLFY